MTSDESKVMCFAPTHWGPHSKWSLSSFLERGLLTRVGLQVPAVMAPPGSAAPLSRPPPSPREVVPLPQSWEMRERSSSKGPREQAFKGVCVTRAIPGQS